MANFFKRITISIAKTVSEFNNFPFSVREAFEHFGNAITKHFLSSTNSGILCTSVRKQVTKVTVFTIANGTIQTDWVTTHCCHTTSLINWCSGSSSYFFNSRFTAILLQKLTSNISNTAHCLNHVDRNSNSAALVCDSPCNGLSNPPRSICTELKPPPIFKLVNGTHQASISFLNQIKKRKTTIPIFFCYRHNKSQIALGKTSFRTLVAGKDLIYFFHASLQAARCFLTCSKYCSVLINEVLPV